MRFLSILKTIHQCLKSVAVGATLGANLIAAVIAIVSFLQ
jgi:hypothetical protein